MKKIISLFMIVVLVLMGCVPVFATNKQEDINLSEFDINNYEKYKIDFNNTNYKARTTENTVV